VPYAVAGVIVFILLVAGGVEVDHLMHEYPGQFLMGVSAVLFTAVACGTALLRRAAHGGRQVPLVRELPKAIQAVPLVAAIPAAGPQEELECERGECERTMTTKAAWGVQVHGEPGERLFCSEWCAQAWDSARASR
jgi:hypothetical protein